MGPKLAVQRKAKEESWGIGLTSRNCLDILCLNVYMRMNDRV